MIIFLSNTIKLVLLILKFCVCVFHIFQATHLANALNLLMCSYCNFNRHHIGTFWIINFTTSSKIKPVFETFDSYLKHDSERWLFKNVIRLCENVYSNIISEVFPLALWCSYFSCNTLYECF